jgi:hypothetical protein
MMRAALPRASQRRQTRALRCLQLEQENLNGYVVPEIREMLVVAIMNSVMVVITSDSKNGSIVRHYDIYI